MKTTTIAALLPAGFILVLLATSCGKPVASDPRETAAAAPTATAVTTAQGRGTEPSDLDRPVEELFGETCSHKMKTFECDECRYEVGVVRAPASLLEGGLLRTQAATRQRIVFPLPLTGEVQFDDRQVAHLSTQADGTIRQVRVALGQRVKRGQVLIEIESVAIGEAEGAYLETQAVQRLARRNHDRVAELRADSIASEKEFLQSRQEFEAAEIRAKAAEAALTGLGMSPADVRTLTQASPRGRLMLRAPVDGVVLSLHGVPGEMAKAGDALAIVGNTSTLWVWCNLYERDLAKINHTRLTRDLSATIAVKAYPGEEFPGTVDFVSPAMEEASRTVRLRVRVNNPGGRLLAGMFADVKVYLPGDAEALALPRSAVLEDEGRAFVFVRHQGDYYVRRPVETGRSWNDRVEILKGLRGGETVVADGSFLMKSDVLRSKMGAGCAD